MRAAYGHTTIAWIRSPAPFLQPAAPPHHDPRDPLEPINRKVFKFNDALDKAVTKPVAQGYRAVVPPPVRGGITNFFGNFRDVTTAVNNLLQLKIPRAASDVGRVLINSTVGILGFFDVASRLGLEKHDEDFGQTLGHWGMGPGPFLMLPLLGPSTARDTVGLVGDYFTDPEFYIFNHSPENYIVFGTRVINLRANLLAVEGLLDQERARPVCVSARCLPAAPAQPDLRRQPAGAAERAGHAAPQDPQGDGGRARARSAGPGQPRRPRAPAPETAPQTP